MKKVLPVMTVPTVSPRVIFLAQIVYWVQLAYNDPECLKSIEKLFNYNCHNMKYNVILDNNEEIVMS